jgi:hypothetical protein
MKCWDLRFNAQGLKIIIIVVQVGVVKITCSNSQGAQNKWKIEWNSIYHKNWWFFEFHPSLNVFFYKFFFSLNLFMTKLRVLMLCFPYFTNNYIVAMICISFHIIFICCTSKFIFVSTYLHTFVKTLYNGWTW